MGQGPPARFGARRRAVKAARDVLRHGRHVRRMREDLLPPDLLAMMTPEAVTAGALVLCHEDAPNRMILCAGAGGYASSSMFETDGIFLPANQQSPEAVVENWEAITDTSNQAALLVGAKQTEKFIHKAMAYLQSK